MTNKIRLLIVDDEVRFLQTLSRRLSIRDFDVTPASNGEEAIALARQRPFDLALVDLKMPGVTGEQVLQVLKQEHADIEVIILTGHGSVDSAVRCTQGGSYSYLQKPCETDELLSVLRGAYSKRVQRHLDCSETEMEELLKSTVNESSLSVLRRLRELDSEAK